MSKETALVDKYRRLAENILLNKISPKLTYHNIDHTKMVVKDFIEIGKASNISSKELELGTIAAWFHDTGYSQSINFHEQKSVEILDEEIDDDDFTREEIMIMKKLIICTKMPQEPKTTLEKALCDADLKYIGTKAFVEQSEMLRQEREQVSGSGITLKKWDSDAYSFLVKHEFFTSYAKRTYTTKKEENLNSL